MTEQRIALLFDIDGTLIVSGGAGARSWKLAFDELYGIPADIGEFTDTGMTDPDVGRQTFVAVLDREAGKLDVNDSEQAHQLLEMLWVKQHHDAADPKLLGVLLEAPDARARAAAVRVLCYWRDRVPDVLKLLQARVNDENPRVRLEAVRALSFFHTQEALDIAVESLIYEQDPYLEYTLKETMATLERRVGKK